MRLLVVFIAGLLFVAIWAQFSIINRRAMSIMHGSIWQKLYRDAYGDNFREVFASERFWFMVFGPLCTVALLLSRYGVKAANDLLPLALQKVPSRGRFARQ